LKLSMEAFCHGQVGIDEDGLRTVEPASVDDGVGHELGAVVGAQVGRGSPLGDEPVEDGHHIISGDGTSGDGDRALSGELVDAVQDLH